MWNKEIDIAKKAAQAAGLILNRYIGQVHHIHKKGDIDLVTEADLQAEELIVETLTEMFPGDGILTEEAGWSGSVSQRKWIVDPLDGTTNFAHGFPFFSVSIALEVNGEIVLGIVYNPATEELFEAVDGTGAYLNRERIHVSQTEIISDALLATGFPYDIHKKHDRVLEHFKIMLINARGVRRPGSASIDLCYVAAGRLDGFWEEGLKPWDTAAGVIMVREAGGIITNYGGEAFTPYDKNIVAANPHLLSAMLELLNH
jgi:myo-inositol-1(or 4)-monophosphatase